MTRRRGTASIGASPVLIGAATVLVALVAVFIAYNANSGLPFVPTYDLNAELPSGGKLVKGNEVRVGGFRVGVVKDVRPKVTEVNGERRSVAVAELNLDKKIEPLAKDTQFRVRPRSALGLKYIELQPGTSKATLAVRRHGPGQSSPPSRSSSRTCSRRSTATPAPTSSAPPTASATPSPAAARRSTARSRRSTRSSRRSHR